MVLALAQGRDAVSALRAFEPGLDAGAAQLSAGGGAEPLDTYAGSGVVGRILWLRAAVRGADVVGRALALGCRDGRRGRECRARAGLGSANAVDGAGCL